MEDNEINQQPEKKSMSKKTKIILSVIGVIVLSFVIFLFTPAGKKFMLRIASNYIYSKLDYDKGETLDDNQQVPVATKSPTPSMIPVGPTIRQEDYITNILLIGVEEIYGGSNTDVMMIASMNTKDRTIKLTSLMRDIYVEVEDHGYQKLNAAYALEGIDGIYKVIEDNFHIKMDGYIKVNFQAFEQIVNILGGVEITLTSNEAYYLNHTNYISEPKYRNLVKGTQWVNGNQALGYCRIRKVTTATESDDFGRTQRQRAVLNSMFNKLKSKNLVQLGLVMNEILSKVNIKTDITSNDFNCYLENAVSLNLDSLETFRLPMDDNFTACKDYINGRKSSVLKINDWDKSRMELQDFIYGDYKK